MTDDQEPAGDVPEPGAPLRLLQRVVDVKANEVRALLWSCAYFFCLLSSYFTLRPLREAVGIAEGTDKLPWLWTGTLAGMAIANPVFSYLVSRYPRRKFIPWVHHFFAANLALFFLLMKFLPEQETVYVGRVFYCWLSVFNLFVISVFWGFMADIYKLDQGKRLFGFIGVGGTLGAIAGSWFTGAMVTTMGGTQILLVSVVLIELAVQCVFRLIARSESSAPTSARVAVASAPAPAAAAAANLAEPRRNVFSGIGLVFKMPYLQGIALYTIFYTISASFLYFQQANIVHDSIADRAERTILFARIDLWVNCLTLAMQMFATGRIVVMLGVTFMLVAQPLLTAAGFAALGLSPTLWVLVVFQVLFKSVNQGTAKPAREVLYTVVDRDVKYKSKSFIDTFVYRSGDLVSAWLFDLLNNKASLAIGLSAIAFGTVPVAIVWLVTGLLLGRKQEELAHHDPPAQAGVAKAAVRSDPVG